MRRYPWLPPVDYHDKGETGADIMKHVERLVVIEDEQCTLVDLGVLNYNDKALEFRKLTREKDNFLKKYDFHGFPVVRRQDLLGYVTRDKLKLAIGE